VSISSNFLVYLIHC